MSQDLTVQSPTIPSLPASLRHFVSAVLMNGTVQSRRELTAQERSWAENALMNVKAALRPAIESQTLALVASLLLKFPSQDMNEMTARYRAEGYLIALSDFPAWAIGKSCEWWLKGFFGKGDEHYAFAPSPPQMARLCRIATEEVRLREWQLKNILKARPTVVAEATRSEALRRAEKAKRALEAMGVT